MRRLFTKIQIFYYQRIYYGKFFSNLHKFGFVLILMCLILLFAEAIIKKEIIDGVHDTLLVWEIIFTVLGAVALLVKYISRLYARTPAHISDNYRISKDEIDAIQANLALPTGYQTVNNTFRYVQDANADIISISQYYCNQRPGIDIDDIQALFKRLYQHNNHIFIIIYDKNNDICGLNITIPMKKYLSNNHYLGNDTLMNLDLNKFVAKAGEDKVKLFHTHMLHTMKGQKCLSMLMAFETIMYLHIATVMSVNIDEIVLYTEIFNIAEEKMYTDLGFYCSQKPHKKRKKKLYELRFDGVNHAKIDKKALKKWGYITGNIKLLNHVLKA